MVGMFRTRLFRAHNVSLLDTWMTTIYCKKLEMISDIINEVKKYFVEKYILRGNKHNFLGINI